MPGEIQKNFLMQRRFSGINAYQPVSDLGISELADCVNAYSYDGEIYSRWGKQACFILKPSNNPNYALTEFIRDDGSAVLVFTNNSKLYFATVGTPPLTWTEIKIGGSTSFALNSPNVRIKRAGKYLYVIDGSGTLYRVYVASNNTYTASICTALSVPNAPVSASLTNNILESCANAADWTGWACPTQNNLISNSVFYPSISKSITGATNANPIEVTTSAAHDLVSGSYVTIASVGGNTACNGYFPVTVTASNKFTIPVAGNGNYTSGGTVTCQWITDMGDPDPGSPGFDFNGAGMTTPTSWGINTGWLFDGGKTDGAHFDVAAVPTTSGPYGVCRWYRFQIGIYTIDSHASLICIIEARKNGVVLSSQLKELKTTPGSWLTATSDVSFAGLTSDPDQIRVYLRTGPNNPEGNNSLFVTNAQLWVLDNSLLVSSFETDRLKIAEKNGVISSPAMVTNSGGSYAISGQWIRKDYGATPINLATTNVIGIGCIKNSDIGAIPFRIGLQRPGDPDTQVQWSNTAIYDDSGIFASCDISTIDNADSGFTINISGASNSAGLINIYAPNHRLHTGNTVTITAVVGVAAANGAWVVTVVDSNNFTLNASTYSGAYVSGGTITLAALRSSVKYLYLQFVSDVPGTAIIPDLSSILTIGPISASGNLSIGLTDYNYVAVEALDNSLDITGTPTNNTTDGTILSDPSAASPSLTPTGFQAKVQLKFGSWVNTNANWLYVYRFGGSLAGSNVTTYTSYILVAKCPRWTGGTASGWTWDSVSSTWISTDGYLVWNPSNKTLVDNQPDLNLIGNDFLISGRESAPSGASSIEFWNNRIVLAKDSTIYISWLLTSDAAAGLYFNTVVDTEDPYASIKGGIFPIEANDHDSIVALKTHGQYLDIFKTKSVHLFTGQDPASGFQSTPHLKDAGIGLAGGANAVCNYDLNVAFVGPTGVHEYKAEPIHVSFGALAAFEDAEQAPIISQKIEPFLAPQIKGGTPIFADYYKNCVLRFHGRRLWLFAPTAEDNVQSASFTPNLVSDTVYLNGKFRLTDGTTTSVGYKRGAVWSGLINIRKFKITWSQNQIWLNAYSVNPGDGICFVVQSNSQSAIGTAGGYLGYAGIGNSVAFKFDILQNSVYGGGGDPSANCVGFFTGGADPFGGVDETVVSNFVSGHQIDCSAIYDGTTLTVSYTDTVTHASNSKSTVIDIPLTISSENGYVGFTASCGGSLSTQEVWNVKIVETGRTLGNNSVAYVYDTRPSVDGSGPTGWTRHTGFNICSACSLTSQDDNDLLYLGGYDGQIYEMRGDSDVSALLSIVNATNASPVVLNVLAHGIQNGAPVLVSGSQGNTAANGEFYAGNVSTNYLSLYADSALTVPVPGNGLYTGGGVVGVRIPISWSVTSRGFMNEADDFRYWKSNRPTRGYYLLSTGELAPIVFSVGVYGATGGLNQPPNFTKTYNINGQSVDVRFKVPPDVRGYGAVILTVAGSTVTQSRITALGVEDAKGAVRGNV